MNFTEWHEKYYPNEAKETIHKMSHAWASSKVETLVSQMKDDMPDTMVEIISKGHANNGVIDQS